MNSKEITGPDLPETNDVRVRLLGEFDYLNNLPVQVHSGSKRPYTLLCEDCLRKTFYYELKDYLSIREITPPKLNSKLSSPKCRVQGCNNDYRYKLLLWRLELPPNEYLKAVDKKMNATT